MKKTLIIALCCIAVAFASCKKKPVDPTPVDPTPSEDVNYAPNYVGNYNGSYSYFGSYAYYWSANESNSSNAYYRGLSYNNAIVNSGNDNKSYGYSVRCLRD